MSGPEGMSFWGNLPSVIMLEIFSYLEHKDRINASSVCKNWRYTLFHPIFWKDIKFVLEDPNSITWARHLVDRFALSVQTATIRCHTPIWSSELASLLERLRENRNLRRLYLEPSSSTFEWEEMGPTIQEPLSYTDQIFESLQKIIHKSKQLHTLTLGCNEDLTVRMQPLLEDLAHYHGRTLTHLGIASVKEDPENYRCIPLKPALFTQFEALTILTLDYDYLNDSLLDSLTSGKLERLVVHVHDLREDHPGVSNEAWERFRRVNQRCELRLTLLHAYVGVKVLHEKILRPAMPLTHFKALFCESVNFHGLLLLYTWYDASLKSLVMIDTIDHNELLPLTEDDGPNAGSADMLVLIAWRCRRLSELVWIGHKYYQENLLAIARLRGRELKRFEIAQSDIIRDNEAEFRKTKKEIRMILGKNWKPLADQELTPVMIDAIAGDSRDVIMPMVLEDAK